MYAQKDYLPVKGNNYPCSILFVCVFLFWCLPAKQAVARGNTPCNAAERVLAETADPYDLLDTIFSKYLQDDSVYLCHEQYFRQHYFDAGEQEQAFYNNIVNSRMMAGHWADARTGLKAYYSFINANEHQADASRYWLTLGNFFFSLPEAKLDSAIAAYQKSRALTVGNTRQLLLLNSNLGSAYIQKKQYRIAYDYLSEAKALISDIDVPISVDREAILDNNIGVTYIHRGLLLQADSIFKRAYLDIGEETSSYAQFLILINQATVALLCQEWTSALHYIDKATPLSVRCKLQLDQYFITKLNVLIQVSMFSRAEETLKEYWEYCHQQGRGATLEYKVYSVLLDILIPSRRVNPSLLDTLANTYLGALNGREHRELFFRKLHQYYVQSGDGDAAQRILDDYLQYTQKLQRSRATSDHGELATLFNIRLLEIEKKSAEEQAEMAVQKLLLLEQNHRLIMVVMALAIAAAVAMALLFKSYRAKSIEVKKRLLLLDKHRLQLDKQLKIQRNTVIQMSIGVAQLDQALEEAVDRYAKKPEMLRRKVRMLLNEQLTEPSNFIKHFNLAYPEFFRALTEHVDGWTNNQLRYALLFALGATTKEIAMTVGVSENTVNVNRYRIRQKLSFSGDDDLMDYLRDLLIEHSD